MKNDYLKPDARRALIKSGYQNNKEFVEIYTDLCLLNENLYNTDGFCSQSYKNIIELTLHEMYRRRLKSDYCNKIDDLIAELNTCLRPYCSYYLPEILEHNRKIEKMKEILYLMKKEYVESGVKNDRLR